MHRDIKASNILIGSDGAIKISDFGITAKLKRGKKRSTFIGSPCYMAPEVLDQDVKTGYDSKADIWSLGITALELAYGKPPNSEISTMKLILKTINGEPPKLIKESCFDENFEEFVTLCLQKDPTKRKSADELLKLCKGFFSKAKGREYLKDHLLKGLNSLEKRFKEDHDKQNDEKDDKSCDFHSKKIESFEFDLSTEDENSRDSPPSVDIQLNCVPHLSRGLSDYYLKKSLSTNSCALLESPNSDEKKIKAGLMVERSVSMTHQRRNCTNTLLHIEKESKLGLSKGDEFVLPEDEM